MSMGERTRIPRQRGSERDEPLVVRAVLDRSVAFLREGFPFFGNRARQWGSRSYELRLLGRRALCLRGREGAELFYDSSRIRGARMVPLPVRRMFFGPGAVQLIGGDAHKHRKAMLLSITAEKASLARLGAVADERYAVAARRWQEAGRVTLFDEAVVTLGEIAMRWAGIPLDRSSAARSYELAALVDGFGSVGPRFGRAVLARVRLERWARRLVSDVRNGTIRPPQGTALAVICAHRELDGNLLPERVAAADLINLIRPTVAIAWYVAYAALALHEHPQWRDRVASDDEALEAFCHEVRRFYPLAPALADRTKRRFLWRGRDMPAGRMVVLDLYGTCHDADTWEQPHRFDPERFVGRSPDPYAFVPQGGGDLATGHRCAGERVTMDLLQAAVRVLTGLTYQVPSQDLSVPLDRMPSRPRSGVVLNDIRTPVTVAAG